MGLTLSSYPYFNPAHPELDFNGLCHAIESLPEKTAVLLHGCCHNPSGVDPSLDQWKQLSSLIKRKRLIPFFDLAYIGMGDEIDADCAAVRLFAEEGHEMIVTVSFSKNMGLYGERVGALFIVARDPDIRKKIATNIKQIVRSEYSNPPIHGVLVASTVLNTPELYEEWKIELQGMCDRIKKMRALFCKKLLERGIDWSFLTTQKGFFSLLNITLDQVNELRTVYGIYLLENGRINLAGLIESNIDYVADSFAKVLKK